MKKTDDYDYEEIECAFYQDCIDYYGFCPQAEEGHCEPVPNEDDETEHSHTNDLNDIDSLYF